MKLQQSLRKLDAVEWLEGVDLLRGEVTLLPEAVELVPEVDNELLNVLLLDLLKTVHLELQGSENRPAVALDKTHMIGLKRRRNSPFKSPLKNQELNVITVEFGAAAVEENS